MSNCLDAAAARFSAALIALTSAKSLSEVKLGLAVSGGPDSMAMLVLAHHVLGTSFSVATIDHGLRGEAADEAEFVASFCSERGISHQILRPQKPITGNIQSEARSVRYALLHVWATTQGCDWIATAHHADDQLETLLMRIARGAGISGLSAIRARHKNIIRPLLGFTKDELDAVCDAAGIAACLDPSNENTDFDRVRMRQWLAQSDTPFNPTATLRATSALTQCDEALEWTARRLESERMSEADAGMITIDAKDVPPELQRRLLLRALERLEPGQKTRGSAIDRALEALRNGEKAMIGEWLCTGGAPWSITAAPPRRI
jgi:tRNA(Ile)-lysidine synthase